MVRFITNFSSLLAAFTPRLATAFSGTAETSARKSAAAFLQALHATNVQRAMRYVAVPFLGREQQRLETEDEVLEYLHAQITDNEGYGLPDTIVGILPYENSSAIIDEVVLELRNSTLKAGDFLLGIGYNGSPCGYMLVKSNAAGSKVVGIAYEPIQSGFRG